MGQLLADGFQQGSRISPNMAICLGLMTVFLIGMVLLSKKDGNDN